MINDQLKSEKGETIMETVIAFVIIAMLITFVGIAIGMSIRNMGNARNRIIAINIAREGLEGMRNIRDTNWLKFNSKRRTCWNALPSADPGANCNPATLIEPGKYIIYKQGKYAGVNTYRWRLSPMKWTGTDIQEISNDTIPAPPTLDTYYYNTITQKTYHGNGTVWEDITELFLMDIDLTTNTDNNGTEKDDLDIYNPLYPQDKDALGTSIKKSAFRREIVVEYLQNDGTLVDKTTWDTLGVPAKDALNRMRVTSRVMWYSGGREFKVELTTHLTDYLGRESLGG